MRKKIGGIMRVENSQSRSFWVWESDSVNFRLNKRGNFRSAAFVGVGGGGRGKERGKGRGEVLQDNVVLWTELIT